MEHVPNAEDISARISEGKFRLPGQQEAGAGHETLIFRTSFAFDVCCLCCFGNCVACWRAESTANLRRPTDDATRTAGISATHSQCQVASGTATHSFRASRTDARTSPAKGCNSTGNGSRPRPRNGSRSRPRNGSRSRPRNGSRSRPRGGGGGEGAEGAGEWVPVRAPAENSKPPYIACSRRWHCWIADRGRSEAGLICFNRPKNDIRQSYGVQLWRDLEGAELPALFIL